MRRVQPCPRWALLGVLVGTGSCGEAPEATGTRSEVQTVVHLRELPSAKEIGVEEQGDPFALLFRVQDALLLEEKVVVLDGSAPWIRIFDRDGGLYHSAVSRGEGPGEAIGPRALSPLPSGELMLSEAQRAQVLTSTGAPVSTVFLQNHLIRWAGRFCDRGDVIWAIPLGEEDPVSVLVEVADSSEMVDTLNAWGPLRGAWTSRDAPHVIPSRSGVFLYSEELDTHRLLELDCQGALANEVRLEPLGLPERYDDLPDGSGFGLFPAEPPLPSGLARTEGYVVWAVRQELHTSGAAPDSVTVVRMMGRDQRDIAVQLSGWYKLVDGSPDGELLWIGNEPIAHVVIVDIQDLLDRAR